MLYSRFCPQKPVLAHNFLLCRHLSQPRRPTGSHPSNVAAGGAWLAGYYPTHPPRCGEIQPASTGQTHSPCSPLYARLAGGIAATAGRLLPYPFTPGRLAPVGLLSVAVVVATPLPMRCPHLLFRGATALAGLPRPGRSREVPLPRDPGSDDPHCPEFLTCKGVQTIAYRRARVKRLADFGALMWRRSADGAGMAQASFDSRSLPMLRSQDLCLFLA